MAKERTVQYIIGSRPGHLQIDRADFENGRFADSEFLAGAGFESVHRVIPLHAFLSVFVPSESLCEGMNVVILWDIGGRLCDANCIVPLPVSLPSYHRSVFGMIMTLNRGVP